MGESGQVVGAGASRIRTPDQRVRVFVSSTLGELAEERQAARAAVEQLRLTPVLFELGARPHPPRALYRSYLEQSDVFVAVYWQRYGWVAPDMDISGLEDELRLSAGMPRLVYVKRPAPEMEPGLAAMLESLQGDDGPSYKPFADAAELRELLVDDLSLLLTERFDRSDDAGAGSEPAAPGRPTSNLPAPTSTFVGREAELVAIGELLDDGAIRLVTLSGPGGTGKTRLAVEAARAAEARFADGVCFVDLSADREADDAFAAVARALDASPGPGSVLDRVSHELASRHVLLVLDNVEQVTSVGPGLVELLQRCPGVQILVTSRETLRVSAEYLFPVPVMSLPTADSGRLTIDDVLASEAGRLFVQRAAAAGPGVALTDDDADDVAVLCRRLDGLPLAIELAAARVTLFSVAELRARLEERLDLLTGGGRDRPDRQRTIHDAIAWSNELLTDEERTVFQLLSVFAAGRLTDIEATLGDLDAVRGVDVVDATSSLVDKNLVRVVPGTDRRLRLSMLRTIREYAADQLAGSPDLEAAARQAHASHYSAVACQLHRRLDDTDRAEVLALLGDELGNLRAAWDHSLGQGEVDCLDELLEPLWGYHEARGDYRGAVDLGESLLGVLADLPDTPERASREYALRANLARTQVIVHGFSREAEQAIVEALARFEASDDARRRFPALRSLAALHLWRSDFEQGAAAARELRAIAEAEHDPAFLVEAHLMSCISDRWPRDVPGAAEEADTAVGYFEETTSGFVAFRVGPNPGVVSHAIAALLQWMEGRPETAVVSMDRALDLADELRHPYSRAFALHHASLLDLWRSDLASVAVRVDESKQLADAHGYAVWGALALVLSGAAGALGGDADRGVTEMEDGFSLYRELETPPIFWPALLVIRAGVHGSAGRVERGLELIEDAWAGIDAGHPNVADIALAHGDLLLAGPAADPVAAGELFERAALASAERGARMTELLALTRLVGLRPDPRGTADATRRLRELYATFTEGFDAPPLAAAAAVLDADG